VTLTLTHIRAASPDTIITLAAEHVAGVSPLGFDPLHDGLHRDKLLAAWRRIGGVKWWRDTDRCEAMAWVPRGKADPHVECMVDFAEHHVIALCRCMLIVLAKKGGQQE
jgi:hypothetical protein